MTEIWIKTKNKDNLNVTIDGKKSHFHMVDGDWLKLIWGEELPISLDLVGKKEFVE